MKIRRILFLIPVFVIILLFGIYLFSTFSTPSIGNTSTIATTETITSGGTTQTLTVNASVFQLQDFEICPSNCNYPSPYISGNIYFNNTHVAIKNVDFFVNGVGGSIGDIMPSGVAEDIGYFFKGTTSIHILPNHPYTITAEVTFWDNTTYFSSETIMSDQIP